NRRCGKKWPRQAALRQAAPRQAAPCQAAPRQAAPCQPAPLIAALRIPMPPPPPCHPPPPPAPSASVGAPIDAAPIAIAAARQANFALLMACSQEKVAPTP